MCNPKSINTFYNVVYMYFQIQNYISKYVFYKYILGYTIHNIIHNFKIYFLDLKIYFKYIPYSTFYNLILNIKIYFKIHNLKSKILKGKAGNFIFMGCKINMGVQNAMPKLVFVKFFGLYAIESWG